MIYTCPYCADNLRYYNEALRCYDRKKDEHNYIIYFDYSSEVKNLIQFHHYKNNYDMRVIWFTNGEISSEISQYIHPQNDDDDGRHNVIGIFNYFIPINKELDTLVQNLSMLS